MMKKIIKAKRDGKEKQFLLQCSCGCGLLEFRDFSDDDILILYYSTKNLKKRDKFAWDIVIEKTQARELIENLQELVGDK